jgi:hypothetical protein
MGQPGEVARRRISDFAAYWGAHARIAIDQEFSIHPSLDPMRGREDFFLPRILNT